MEQDPATYQRFSQLIDETIQAYRQGRLREAEYLAEVNALLAQLQTGATADVPAQLTGRADARAFWSSLRELPLSSMSDSAAAPSSELLATVALDLDRIITERKVRDWTRNPDVQNRMRTAIEDYLYELRSTQGMALTTADIDRVLETILELAKQRERMT